MCFFDYVCVRNTLSSGDVLCNYISLFELQFFSVSFGLSPWGYPSVIQVSSLIYILDCSSWLCIYSSQIDLYLVLDLCYFIGLIFALRWGGVGWGVPGLFDLPTHGPHVRQQSQLKMHSVRANQCSQMSEVARVDFSSGPAGPSFLCPFPGLLQNSWAIQKAWSQFSFNVSMSGPRPIVPFKQVVVASYAPTSKFYQ